MYACICRSVPLCTPVCMCTCMHVYVEASPCAHLYACTHAHACVCMRVCACTCVSGCTHVCMDARMPRSPSRRLHRCTHAHMHPCTHAPMHPCTHAPMHTCTHAHMHPHAPMRTCIPSWSSRPRGHRLLWTCCCPAQHCSAGGTRSPARTYACAYARLLCTHDRMRAYMYARPYARTFACTYAWPYACEALGSARSLPQTASVGRPTSGLAQCTCGTCVVRMCAYASRACAYASCMLAHADGFGREANDRPRGRKGVVEEWA